MAGESAYYYNPIESNTEIQKLQCLEFKFSAQWTQEVVAQLLAPGVETDPNYARTADGTTPLWIAAQEGHEAVVALLLAPGVGTNPNQACIHRLADACDLRNRPMNQAVDGTTPLCMLSKSSFDSR